MHQADQVCSTWQHMPYLGRMPAVAGADRPSNCSELHHVSPMRFHAAAQQGCVGGFAGLDSAYPQPCQKNCWHTLGGFLDDCTYCCEGSGKRICIMATELSPNCLLLHLQPGGVPRLQACSQRLNSGRGEASKTKIRMSVACTRQTVHSHVERGELRNRAAAAYTWQLLVLPFIPRNGGSWGSALFSTLGMPVNLS
jgi:hypothetical protein